MYYDRAPAEWKKSLLKVTIHGFFRTWGLNKRKNTQLNHHIKKIMQYNKYIWIAKMFWNGERINNVIYVQFILFWGTLRLFWCKIKLQWHLLEINRAHLVVADVWKWLKQGKCVGNQFINMCFYLFRKKLHMISC